MPNDPHILEALRQAVLGDPENISLRMKLANALLSAGAEEGSLHEFHAILERDAMNRSALEGAARALDSLGDHAQAAEYRDVLASLPVSANDPPSFGGDHGSGPTPSISPTTPPFPMDWMTPPNAPQRNQPQPFAAPSFPTPASLSPIPGEAQPVRAEGEAETPTGWWETIKPEVTLADVGGMTDVKQRITLTFLAPARNPELVAAYGVSSSGGLLLYGPPGCGKTFLARALAGELGARFISVGLHDVLSMWMGQSEAAIHSLFETARANAPCVVFFDEVDAIGQRRSNVRGGAIRNVVSQLLSEMDGLNGANGGVFTLAATNNPWDVDPAFLRPGRFDRSSAVFPPDADARRAIFAAHLRRRPQGNIDVEWLISHTEGFSGADIAHLCDSAGEACLAKALATGEVAPISTQDFAGPMKDVHPSTRAWFETARNYVLYGNQDHMYDSVAEYMKSHRLL